MKSKTRKHYSAEFKREAVQLLEQGNKEATQLARELGVRRNQLYKWKEEVDQHGESAFPGKGKRPKHAQNEETAVLKAEVNQLREENEILKKAAIYFARGSG